MKPFAILFLLTGSCFLPFNLLYSQNVIIGSNGFVTQEVLQTNSGFGVYTRMGVEVFNSEIGIKSFYGNLTSLEAYGVSLYSFLPFYNYKKWEALAHVEGGFAFVYSPLLGSANSFVMGLGPSLRYNLKDYFQFEITLEYAVFASISEDAPIYTQVLFPTIGWSVRI